MGKSNGENELIETNAKDAPVKDIHWHTNEIETNGARIDDPGIGNRIVLRKFDFALPPVGKKPKKEELLKYHSVKITPFLWKDGLEAIADPRLYFEKGRKFSIVVACVARKGHIYSYKDTPVKLHEALQQSTKK